MSLKINYIIAQAAAAKFMLDGIAEVDPFLLHNTDNFELPTLWKDTLTEHGVEIMNQAKQISYNYLSFCAMKEHLQSLYGSGSLYMIASEGGDFMNNLLGALQEGYRGGYETFMEKFEEGIYVSIWKKQILKEIFEYAKLNDVNIHSVSSNIEIDNGLVDRTNDIDPRINNFYKTSTFLFVPGKTQAEISSPIVMPGINLANQFIQGKTFGQISAVQLCLTGV